MSTYDAIYESCTNEMMMIHSDDIKTTNNTISNYTRGQNHDFGVTSDFKIDVVPAISNKMYRQKQIRSKTALIVTFYSCV